MSLSILPNQPIAFNIDYSNKCNTRYFLPVQRGDAFNLQGFTTPVDGSDLSNGSFLDRWTLPAGFSQTGGNVLNYSGISLLTGPAQSPPIYFQKGKLYLLQAGFTVTNNGGAGSGFGIIINIGSTFLPLPGLNVGQGINQSFGISYYYIPASTGYQSINIGTNYANIQFHAEGIFMEEFSAPAVAAYDNNNNYVQNIDLQSCTYFTQTLYSAGHLNDAVRFQISFALDALPDGCYTLQAFDGTNNVLNGNFNDATNWTLGANWTITGNKAWHSGPHNDALTTDIFVEPLQPLTLQFQCTNNIAGTSFNVSLTYSDASVQSFNVTTGGLKTFTFTPPNGISGLATLSFASASVHGPSNFLVWAVSVAASGAGAAISNLISLQTQFPFPTLLFTATNNDNAFNFDYSQDLTHGIRLWGKLRYKDYKTQADEANFSDNSNVLLTAYLEKIYEVIIGDAAEFVHDCLTMMQINDTFTINGETYIRDGNYAIKQRKSTELAPAAFDVKPIQGISKNWNIE